MSQYADLGGALGQWLRRQLASPTVSGMMSASDKQWLDDLRTNQLPSWSAIKAEYQSLSLTQLQQRLQGSPDLDMAVTLLLATGQMTDRLAPVALLPLLTTSESWNAGTVPVAGMIGASSVYPGSPALKSRDGNKGGGWVSSPTVDPVGEYLYAQFVSPVTVKRLTLYVSTSTFSPTRVALECASGLSASWHTVATLDVQQVANDQLFAIPAYGAQTCWRVRILATAGNRPSILEWQLDGLPA